jgi:hypothetical protein
VLSAETVDELLQRHVASRICPRSRDDTKVVDERGGGAPRPSGCQLTVAREQPDALAKAGPPLCFLLADVEDEVPVDQFVENSASLGWIADFLCRQRLKFGVT